MSMILEGPSRDYRSIRVSLESRNGMCVLFSLVRAEMQWPSLDRLPLMHLSSVSRISLSEAGRFLGMLNFSEPARSTILS